MPRSRFNYICITECGELKKYAAQSLDQIIDETDDEYRSIIREDLHHDWDEDYTELTWYD